jgi:hypothetical protein
MVLGTLHCQYRDADPSEMLETTHDNTFPYKLLLYTLKLDLTGFFEALETRGRP